MVVEKGYKQTEVGVIPEVWDCFSVRQLIDLLTDYDANGSFESVATNVNVYDFENFAWYVRSTDLENNSSLTQVKYVDEKSYKFLKKTSLFGGELLFLKRGDIGNVYLFEMRTEKATLAPNLYLLKLNHVSIPKYLYYFFTSDTGQRQLKSKNASSTLGALYKDDVKSIIVPLPPLPEQTAIANALSDMDALIAQTEKLIEKKKAIKQGVMQELLKPKEGWVTKKLGEVCDIYQPQTISAEKFTNDGYLVYGANGIVGFYHSYNHKEWQVMITCRGSTCGTVNKSNDYSWITGNAMVMNVDSNKEIDKEFFYYLLSKQDFSNTITGSGQPQIVRAPLANFWIALPKDKNEQSMIGKTLSELDALIDKITTKLQKFNYQKQGMMQALLTGKIRLIC